MDYHKSGYLLSCKTRLDYNDQYESKGPNRNIDLGMKSKKIKEGKKKLNLTVNEVIEATKHKTSKLEEHSLKKIIEEKTKENYLLKSFLKYLEETISSKESLELALEHIHQVNNAKSMDVIIKIVQNRTIKDNQDKNLKKPKNIVIINPSTNNQNKEHTISLLNNKIDRQLKEIKKLKEELVKKKYGNDSLAGVFEECVNKQMENNRNKNQKLLISKNTPIPLYNITDVDHFSEEDKEEIIKMFLGSNIILKKLSEIILSQLKTRIYNSRTRHIKIPLATDNNPIMDKGNESLGVIPLKNRKSAFPMQLNTAKIIFHVKSLPRIVLKKQVMSSNV